MSGQFLSLDQLKVVTRGLDTNRNNRIDRHEVDFQTQQAIREASRDQYGYANDVIGTTELARAMQADRVTLKRLPAAVADHVAIALAGGDNVISRYDYEFDAATARAIDRNYDGVITRTELSDALQDGTLEIGSTIRRSYGSAYPTHGYDDRPGYDFGYGDVFAKLERLKRLYNTTSMTSAEKSRLERQIVADEMRRLQHSTELDVFEKLSILNRLYNTTGMTSAEKSSYERQFVQAEVDFLAADHTEPVYVRLNKLQRLYTSTGMTSSEYQAAQRRIRGY